MCPQQQDNSRTDRLMGHTDDWTNRQINEPPQRNHNAVGHGCHRWGYIGKTIDFCAGAVAVDITVCPWGDVSLTAAGSETVGSATFAPSFTAASTLCGAETMCLNFTVTECFTVVFFHFVFIVNGIKPHQKPSARGTSRPWGTSAVMDLREALHSSHLGCKKDLISAAWCSQTLPVGRKRSAAWNIQTCPS